MAHSIMMAGVSLLTLGLGMPAHASLVVNGAMHPVATERLGDLATTQSQIVAYGWDGRRDYRHRYRRGGIDAGDVLAGVIVIGGAIAVAKALENRREDGSERRYPDDRYRKDRSPDARYREYLRDRDSGGNAGQIDYAIDECVNEVERSARVDTVESAQRRGQDWIVEGDLREGGTFHCEMDTTGRVRDIDIENGERLSERDDDGTGERESDRAGYGGDYYADARVRRGMDRPDDRGADRWSEAEPGSTVDDRAETWYDGADEQEWQRGETDDRYDTAMTSAFSANS